MLVMFNDCLGPGCAGRATKALPKLRAIEMERPESAAVQMTLAVGPSLTNDLRGAERAFTRPRNCGPRMRTLPLS